MVGSEYSLKSQKSGLKVIYIVCVIVEIKKRASLVGCQNDKKGINKFRLHYWLFLLRTFAILQFCNFTIPVTSLGYPRTQLRKECKAKDIKKQNLTFLLSNGQKIDKHNFEQKLIFT